MTEVQLVGCSPIATWLLVGFGGVMGFIVGTTWKDWMSARRHSRFLVGKPWGLREFDRNVLNRATPEDPDA